MSFEQALAALKEVGVDLDEGKAENPYDRSTLEGNEKLQKLVNALDRIGALNSASWKYMKSQKEEVLTYLTHVIRTQLPQPTAAVLSDPGYQKIAAAIAIVAAKHKKSKLQPREEDLADQVVQAWRCIQDNVAFRHLLLNCPSFNSSMLKNLQQPHILDNIEILSKAGLFPPSEKSPYPLQQPETLLKAVTHLRELVIISREEHQKYQAIFALHEVNKLSQETIKQVCDSDHPINTASKILLHEALDRAKICAERLGKPTRQRLIEHLKHETDAETQTVERLTLNTVRMLSHPLKKFQSRAKKNKDPNQIAETYTVAEPVLKVIQKLHPHHMTEKTWQETLVGTPKRQYGHFGKPKDGGNPYSTYGSIKEAMEKASKSPQLVPHNAGDNDDVAGPIGNHQL
ncbi:hypothetical protein PsalMR5_03795 [Piscirickettsia salmonis]|uniref:hypothetical protein n=1 Tax=Piscirickettsia salmonis TaxID=1238 RepID=UPI0012BB07ED|nr:hypothetical protein [Piscirickettsia salmonis]QGP56312.1 hypothetical protein PsalSR1_03790 [Piscirickettsia salmonis]QGP57818.1 hypothetical protein PsalBI1_00362 [Piscirickettsia salmonis]QGP65881.1 hypothetical protein PsalMR5_03795 [Piscirickettsia salmonis]